MLLKPNECIAVNYYMFKRFRSFLAVQGKKKEAVLEIGFRKADLTQAVIFADPVSIKTPGSPDVLIKSAHRLLDRIYSD